MKITKRQAKAKLGIVSDVRLAAYLSKRGHKITRQALHYYEEDAVLSSSLRAWLLENEPELFPVRRRA